jgi:tight adherence protein B
MSPIAPTLDRSLLLMTVLVFVSAALLTEGLYQYWRSRHGPSARKIRKRLALVARSEAAETQAALTRRSQAPAWPRPLRQAAERLGFAWLERRLSLAGVSINAGAFALGCATGALAVGLLAGMVLRQPLAVSAAVALMAGGLPVVWLGWKASSRMAAIERQLAQALDTITRALRAGHGFTAGLQTAAEETAEPLGRELRTVVDEVRFGVSMRQALDHLAQRVPDSDLRFFVIAVQIQQETGGNLSEVLSSLSALIRQRQELLGRVRALTAEGRMSAWVLSVLPFAMAGSLAAINPDFMRVLWTDPGGRSAIAAALIMMAAGLAWMRLVIRIRP